MVEKFWIQENLRGYGMYWDREQSRVEMGPFTANAGLTAAKDWKESVVRIRNPRLLESAMRHTIQISTKDSF